MPHIHLQGQNKTRHHRDCVDNQKACLSGNKTITGFSVACNKKPPLKSTITGGFQKNQNKTHSNEKTRICEPMKKGMSIERLHGIKQKNGFSHQ